MAVEQLMARSPLELLHGAEHRAQRSTFRPLCGGGSRATSRATSNCRPTSSFVKVCLRCHRTVLRLHTVVAAMSPNVRCCLPGGISRPTPSLEACAWTISEGRHRRTVAADVEMLLNRSDQHGLHSDRIPAVANVADDTSGMSTATNHPDRPCRRQRPRCGRARRSGFRARPCRDTRGGRPGLPPCLSDCRSPARSC